MAKPWIHAKSSARKHGGVPEDYLRIHNLLDSSKAVFPDNRYRALMHSSWFIFIVEQIIGTVFKNSAGREVSTRDIAEQHILEDFGGRFIPTPQDYLEHLQRQDRMHNGRTGCPSSHKGLRVRLTNDSRTQSEISENGEKENE